MPSLPRLILPNAAASRIVRLPMNEPPAATSRNDGQRLRIWDIAATFHCSIIGTCLTTGELRQVLIKAGQDDARSASDHTLHGRGVRLAGQRDQAAKLLNKALDKRHETSVKRLPRQAGEEELRAIWRECFDRGDIAGPYWALMSHPASSPDLIREIFGEVHMLSHLVGSASRLDIARLTRLEADLEQERARGRRQETRLKVAADERTALQQRIRRLEERVLQADAAAAALDRPVRSDRASRSGRLETEALRSDTLAQRLSDSEVKCSALQRELEQLQDLSHAILRENEALETTVASGLRTSARQVPAQPAGPVLYVGGRRNLFDHLRAYAESRDIDLILHDGGMEDSTTLLPALVGQATTVLFPVDHISHAAAGILKRLCRAQGKSYLPLRSAGLASFLAAVSGVGDAYGRL